MFANAVSSPDQERSFWALMTLGFSLWTSNQAAWSYQEIVLAAADPRSLFL